MDFVCCVAEKESNGVSTNYSMCFSRSAGGFSCAWLEGYCSSPRLLGVYYFSMRIAVHYAFILERRLSWIVRSLSLLLGYRDDCFILVLTSCATALQYCCWGVFLFDERWADVLFFCNCSTIVISSLSFPYSCVPIGFLFVFNYSSFKKMCFSGVNWLNAQFLA